MNFKLSNGDITTVDDEDSHLLNEYGWYAQIYPDHTYCAATVRPLNGKRTIVKLHRLVLNIKDPAIVVDHINGNGLDNRKCNLRICTHQENMRNRFKKCTGFSKYKGVYYSQVPNKPYRIKIKNSEGKHVSVGNFKTEKEAALKYNELAVLYHGKFARLNIIEKEYIKWD